MLVGLLSRWCFLIGGHGRRQWAGRTVGFGGLRKSSPNSFKQTRSSSAIGRQESLHEGFGDGPRNFEPWSSDLTTPELAPPNQYYTPQQRERRFQLSTDLTCIAALPRRVFAVLGSNREKASHGPIPIPPGYRGHSV
ncbi:hypothetical protein TNCV_3892921 [Trichonephila clavipes]|nr:hypothetical protein TNCV_3892921 [Trichonephila clavipes]